MSKKNKLIILDRDGVINHDSDHYIKSVEEWIPIDGSLEAIAKLNNLGYEVAIATNQSGIARGFYSLSTLEAMHTKLHQLLKVVGGKISYIACCPHGPDDGCSCRKPKPGMLLEIADHFSIPPEDVIFIGDTLSDMKAAKNAGINFVLVKTGKGKKTLEENKGIDTVIFESLSDFVDQLRHEKTAKKI